MSSINREALWREAIMDLISVSLSVLLVVVLLSLSLLLVLEDVSLSVVGGTLSHN
jgi:hypothetical protein